VTKTAIIRLIRHLLRVVIKLDHLLFDGQCWNHVWPDPVFRGDHSLSVLRPVRVPDQSWGHSLS
jgi:hypothetical protein